MRTIINNLYLIITLKIWFIKSLEIGVYEVNVSCNECILGSLDPIKTFAYSYK